MRGSARFRNTAWHGALSLAMVVFVAALSASVPGIATAALAGAGFLGVTAVTTSGASNQVIAQEFSSIKQDRFNSVRLPIQWNDVEYVQGNLDWSSTDARVIAASSAGLNILGVVTYVPPWAATPEGRNAIHPSPANPAAFANFAKLAAQRYKTAIRHWEIWNEPNAVGHFAPRPDLWKYAQMLKLSYSAIKAVDPGATIMTGGTAPVADDGANISPAMFIFNLYMQGIKGSFDAIAVHPYCAPALLSQGGDLWSSSKGAISAITWTMAVMGDGGKPIWATEFGAPTGPNGVTEARQSQILVDGINYFRSLPNAGPMFIFDHRDLGTGNTNPEFAYGLRRTDFSAKPSLAAVQALLLP